VSLHEQPENDGLRGMSMLERQGKREVRICVRLKGGREFFERRRDGP
jgi:hypothetical protein